MADPTKIAYLIQAHADPQHFGRLVRALDDRADFWVHIDRKSDPGPFRAEAAGMDHVRFVSDRQRVAVHWGGFSQVRATLAMVDMWTRHAALTGEEYKKVVLLSGSCYPLRSTEAIHAFMDAHRGVNFIRAVNLSHPANHSTVVDHIRKRYLYDFPMRRALPMRLAREVWRSAAGLVAPRKTWVDCRGERLEVWHGSQWWALEPDTLLWMMRWRAAHPCLERYLRPAAAADEKYFHTIFWNSPFTATADAPPEPPGEVPPGVLGNLHLIDDSLTKWFTLEDSSEDWKRLAESKKLFARKFSTARSGPLLERIDAQLRGATTQDPAR